MASAKGATTSRRSSSGRSSKTQGDEHAVSPARWAGVAFVIVAITAAIVLGMVSASDPTPAPAQVALEATPEPSATPLDGRVPTAQPVITNPVAGVTSEIDFPVTVDVPAEELPKKVLKLLVLREDDIVGEQENPKTGGTITVNVRVDKDSVNELTAVLTGPGGWGPRSEPVEITVDRDAPELAITDPEDKYETYEDRVTVEGTSEVGADVVVTNQATGKTVKEVVGNSGTFDVSMRLKRGATNKIVATSRDQAEIERTATVRVKQVDGTPRVKIKKVSPIKRASLPAKIKIVVDVTDATGKPLPDAQVDYTLGGPDRTSLIETDFTNADGRSIWRPRVEPSSSTADALELTVTVTSPRSDDTEEATQTIEFR